MRTIFDPNDEQSDDFQIYCKGQNHPIMLILINKNWLHFNKSYGRPLCTKLHSNRSINITTLQTWIKPLIKLNR